MFAILNFFNSLVNLGFYLIVILPIASFIAYLCAIIISSLIGGPTWLWFVIMLLLGIAGAKEKLDKAKQKFERENDA